MRLFSVKHEESVYDLFGEMSHTLVISTESLSRLMGEAPSERAVLAKPIHRGATDAAAVNRRIANILAISLITPFEAEVLHALSMRIVETIREIDRTADLTVRLSLGSLPAPLLDVCTVLERAAALTTEAMWSLSHVSRLSSFYAEMRRVDNHAQELLRRSTADLLNPDERQDDGSLVLGPGASAHTSTASGAPMAALTLMRSRESIASLERVTAAFQRIAVTVDLLRVKDS